MKRFTLLRSCISSLLLILSFNTSTQAQPYCCSGLNFNGFQTYCITNFISCGGCTEAYLDASWGINGDWVLGVSCAPPGDCAGVGCGPTMDGGFLPVELVAFDVSYHSDKIALRWSTASEVNNRGFEVQKSFDGKNWEELDFIEGNGTSHQVNKYSFTDNNPLIGLNYYRLKQIDYDEAYEFSTVKTLIWQGSNDPNKFQLAVMPNPASEWITAAIPAQLDRTNNIQFDIFDQVGKLVRSQTITAEDEVRIPLDGLNPGHYVLKASNQHIQYLSRFIKN